MWIAIKNWLIKFAVKGLIKAGKSEEAAKILREIIGGLEQQVRIKKKKKLEKQG